MHSILYIFVHIDGFLFSIQFPTAIGLFMYEQWLWMWRASTTSPFLKWQFSARTNEINLLINAFNYFRFFFPKDFLINADNSNNNKKRNYLPIFSFCIHNVVCKTDGFSVAQRFYIICVRWSYSMHWKLLHAFDGFVCEYVCLVAHLRDYCVIYACDLKNSSELVVCLCL